MSGTKHALTLGLAGSGKSSCLNEAMGNEVFDTSRGVGHCTTDVSFATLAPGLDVVNVPGLFGISQTMREWLDQVDNALGTKNIAVVLLVNRADNRGGPMTRMLIYAINEFFKNFDAKTVIPVFTHCDVLLREGGQAALDRCIEDWIQFLEGSPHLNNLRPNTFRFSLGKGQGPALKQKILSLAGRQQNKSMTFNVDPDLRKVGQRLVKDAGIPIEVIKTVVDDSSCFGADTHVECLTSGAISVKSIRDVQVGDVLRVDVGGFAPVVTRAHFGYDKDVKVPLVKITFESAGGRWSSMVATPDHLLLVPRSESSDPVPYNIGSLVEGDTIYLATDRRHVTTVLSVEEIWGCRRSIITETGTVVVNSVQASVFMGHPDNHTRLKAILDIGMKIDSVFPGFLSSPRLESAREWFFENYLYPFGKNYAPRDQIKWHAPTVSELIAKMSASFATYMLTLALRVYAAAAVVHKSQDLSDIEDGSTRPTNDKMPEFTPFAKKKQKALIDSTLTSTRKKFIS